MTLEDCINSVKGKIDEINEDLSPEDYIKFLDEIEDHINIQIDWAKDEARKRRSGR